ncbi:MAG: SpoIIIAH-like family protein [Clostridia bacterium]|nr:SpoIIIAH-like family protein [Clostridia bacterium]
MSKNKHTLWLVALALGVTLLWISYDDAIVSTIQSMRYDPERAQVNQAKTGSDKDLAKTNGQDVAKGGDRYAAKEAEDMAKESGQSAANPTVNEQKFNDLLVAASANNPADKFFAEYRLERDRVRGRQVDNLREIVNNPKSVGETVKEAQKRLLSLNENLTKELLVENMLKAKNYNDAIVFLQEGAVTVIVQAKELNQQDIAKISDLVSRTTGKSAQEMVIIPKN